MSYNLNSLKGVTSVIIFGALIGDIKGDTRSLDYCSFKAPITSASYMCHVCLLIGARG